MKAVVKHCAIYTRKSSEEGLDQDFNSLDAQREACLSYIQSQKSERWQALRAEYNDGGFSGGNMERPALKKLLTDIAAGKVNIVVVYKIDRLTRSLMDFAKLVEAFDKHGVTFVSVTQSFNTTTSMGRLTLNVLLSFAQFEREVTGERIRDKIAASKQKGMWMGGATPIGFDCVDRKLVVNKTEATLVRSIFEKYLELGCVRKLKDWLDESGHRTKVRTSQKGRIWGGERFSRGLLYKILTNPVYIGQIKHKDKVYDGQHESILTQDLWTNVQQRLSQKATSVRGAGKVPPYGNLLKGKIVDAFGNKYSPSFTSKGGKQYRYYVSQALLQDRKPPIGIMTRISVFDVEKAVEATIAKEFLSAEVLANITGLDVFDHKDALRIIVAQQAQIDFRMLVAKAVLRIEVGAEALSAHISCKQMLSALLEILELDAYLEPSCETTTIEIPVAALRPRSGHTIIPAQRKSKSGDPFDRSPQELKDWVRGIIWRDDHFKGMTIRAIAQRDNCSESLVAKMIQYSFTAG